MWRIIAVLAIGVVLAAGIPVLGGASDDLPAPTDAAYPRAGRDGGAHRDAETTAAGGEIRVYEPERDRITVEQHAGLPFASAAYEAAAQRDGLKSGRLRRVEERGDNLVLRSREGTVTVVDARTYELLERRTTLPGAVQTETRTTELLPAGSPAVRLAMEHHAKAEVVRTR